MLVLDHPEVSYRDCELCQKVIFEESGRMAVYPRTGEPIKRPPGNKAPCRYGANNCPKGTPEAKRSLTPQNEQVYAHYLECKATGHWPDDEIVRRHAGLIRRIEESVERVQRERLSRLMEANLSIPRL
jgi:hypothetical protein